MRKFSKIQCGGMKNYLFIWVTWSRNCVCSWEGCLCKYHRLQSGHSKYHIKVHLPLVAHPPKSYSPNKAFWARSSIGVGREVWPQLTKLTKFLVKYLGWHNFLKWFSPVAVFCWHNPRIGSWIPAALQAVNGSLFHWSNRFSRDHSKWLSKVSAIRYWMCNASAVSFTSCSFASLDWQKQNLLDFIF